MWVNVEIIGILGASHPLDKTIWQGEEILEDSAVKNVHKLAQADDSNRWLSTARQGSWKAIDRKPKKTEDDLVCRQLHVVVDS